MIMDELILSAKVNKAFEEAEYLKSFKVFDVGTLTEDLNLVLRLEAGKSTYQDLFSRTKYRLPYPLCAFTYSSSSTRHAIIVEEVNINAENKKEFGILGEVFSSWIRYKSLFISEKHNVVGALPAIGAFPITEEGKLIEPPAFMQTFKNFKINSNGELWEKNSNDIEKHVRFDFYTINAALLLLHSKYKVTEDIVFSPKHAKKRAKKGLAPLITYKKLCVPSFLRPQRGETLEHWHVRLHDVRGHFKQQYIKGGHKEIFVEPYQRGDALLGQVHKDYKVEEPK